MKTATAEYVTADGATYRAYGREAFVNPQNVMPASADYVVCNFADRAVGHIVDARQDDPSGRTPIAEPFEAFSESGKFLTSAEDLKGAMWAVVNVWEETRHNPR